MPSTTTAADQPDTSPLRAVIELTKPGITRMVLITTAVGFILGAVSRAWTGPELLRVLTACLVGTALSSAGANALNMWWERERDARMPRTAGRPIPSGRLAPGSAFGLGVIFAVLGPSVLCAWATPASAVVAAVTIASYVLIYTPLKPVTTLSTIVGAFPGALPPVIGFAAAWPKTTTGSTFDALAVPAGWTVFAIMFVWQIPHFLAIAWMYKEDYAAGGHRIIAVEDPTGARTAHAAMIWLAVLVPVSLVPVAAMPALLGWAYAGVALALGGVFIVTGVRFTQSPTRPRAVRMFLASIAYLPLVLLAMVGEAVARSFLQA